MSPADTLLMLPDDTGALETDVPAEGDAIGDDVETLIWFTTFVPPANCLATDSARVRSASVVTVPVRTTSFEVCWTATLLLLIC